MHAIRCRGIFWARRGAGMNEPDSSELFTIPAGKFKIAFVQDQMIPNAGTFLIEREDHTIGNLLRMQLLKDSQVLFSGYKMPHPLEHRIELRVQTTADISPRDALMKALKEIKANIESVKSDLRKNLSAEM